MPLVKVEPFVNSPEDKTDGDYDKEKDNTAEWLQAIIHNDVNRAEKILQQSTSPETLINGFSSQQGQEVSPAQNHLDVSVTYLMEATPWWLVVAGCGSHDLVPLFLDHNVFIHVKDNAIGNNFVHMLVIMNMYTPENTESHVKSFQMLKKSLKSEDLQKLLMHENKQGLRPLELAAKCGCWQIFLHPFACLSAQQIQCAHAAVNYYPMTEYEEYSRIFKSPLFFLQEISKETIAKLTEENSLPDLVKSWGQLHIDSARIFVLLSFGFHLVSPFLLALFDSYVAAVSDQSNIHQLYPSGIPTNATQTCFTRSKSSLLSVLGNDVLRWTLILTLCFCCVIHVLFCVSQWITWAKGILHQRQHNFHPFCCPRTQKEFHKMISQILVQSVLCLSILTTFVLDLLVYNEVCIISSVKQDLLFYFTMLGSAMVFLQWTTFSNRTGIDFLMMRAMGHQTLHVSSVFVLLCIPFIFVNERLLTRGRAECGVNMAVNMDTLYKLVLSSISFAPLGSLEMLEKYQRIAVIVVHLIYIFIAGIVLMNFLIALFSFTATDVMQNKDLVLLITRVKASCNIFLTLCKSKLEFFKELFNAEHKN